jgi:hypothetical protein
MRNLPVKWYFVYYTEVVRSCRVNLCQAALMSCTEGISAFGKQQYNQSLGENILNKNYCLSISDC